MRIAYPGSAYSERLSTALHEAVPYINKTDNAHSRQRSESATALYTFNSTSFCRAEWPRRIVIVDLGTLK